MSGAGERAVTADRAPIVQVDRAIVVPAPGDAVVQDVPAGDGPVRLATVCSGISAGTELSFLTGTNPALHARHDPELGLFRTDLPATGYPVTRLGYMEVARVAESEAAAPPPGALVAATYGHRTGYRLDPLAERMVVLPSDLDPLLGIYVAHMGPICANGLLHAAADLCGTDVRDLGDGVRGRRVAVIGGGVVGLLTGLFARRHGAAEVVLLDPTPQRRAAAEGLGLEAVDPDRTDPAVLLKTRWRHGPGDRGADVVFQCRGRTAALAIALRLLRPQGTVVDLAFYTDDGSAAAPRRGVPPQRAHGPLRADRPGAPRHEPRVGPRAALRWRPSTCCASRARRCAST